MFLYYLDPDGITVEYSLRHGGVSRRRRALAAGDGADQGVDRLLDSFLDPRKATVGAIERMDSAPTQIAAE